MYCLGSRMSIWNLCKFYIISQETTEFSRAPIINAFDILRANSNDIFVPEFNIEPIKLYFDKFLHIKIF